METVVSAGKKELTAGQWKETIVKLHDWLGDYPLAISGGEPLLREDIFDIAEFASKKGASVFIMTNATLLDEASIDRFIGSGVKSFIISLDTLDEKEFDSVRSKKGLTRQVMQAIDLIDGRINVQLTSVITRKSSGGIEGLVKYCVKKKLKVNFNPLVVNLFSAQEADGLNKELWIDDVSKIEAAFSKLIQLKKMHPGTVLNSLSHIYLMSEYYRGKDSLARKLICPIGHCFFRISPYGEVWLCRRMGLPASEGELGNVLTDSPRHIWYSKKANKIRDKIYSCNKTCKVLAYSYRRDFRQKIDRFLELS
ncbi:MAG: radical SAM protein [Nanoarchaeota archaeon]|nr:radical SAM protein [Nanoarchaeota archaeon]